MRKSKKPKKPKKSKKAEESFTVTYHEVDVPDKQERIDAIAKILFGLP